MVFERNSFANYPQRGYFNIEDWKFREKTMAKKSFPFEPILKYWRYQKKRVFFSLAACNSSFVRMHIITVLLRNKCLWAIHATFRALRTSPSDEKPSRNVHRVIEFIRVPGEASVSLSQRVIEQVVDLRFHAFTWRPTNPYATSSFSSASWTRIFPPLPHRREAVIHNTEWRDIHLPHAV